MLRQHAPAVSSSPLRKLLLSLPEDALVLVRDSCCTHVAPSVVAAIGTGSMFSALSFAPAAQESRQERLSGARFASGACSREQGQRVAQRSGSPSASIPVHERCSSSAPPPSPVAGLY